MTAQRMTSYTAQRWANRAPVMRTEELREVILACRGCEAMFPGDPAYSKVRRALESELKKRGYASGGDRHGRN
jgi:hypothetical protein